MTTKTSSDDVIRVHVVDRGGSLHARADETGHTNACTLVERTVTVGRGTKIHSMREKARRGKISIEHHTYVRMYVYDVRPSSTANPPENTAALESP